MSLQNLVFSLTIIMLSNIMFCSLSCTSSGLDDHKDSLVKINNNSRSGNNSHVLNNEVLNSLRCLLVNVEHYGALGDGVTDDSEAFEEAWKVACSSSWSSAVFWVPHHKTSYFLKPVTFTGPCISKVIVKIEGTLEASSDPSDWKNARKKQWITFENITNLVVKGGGTLEGNGQVWWKNSCKRNKSMPCTHAPTALYFSSCKNLDVINLNIRNSPQIHLWFVKCSNVIVSELSITAPGTSPNTDGIHISSSKDVLVNNTVIGTGDDCISIVSGSEKVVARGIYCGPGHGISIGSLGANHTKAQVSGILVEKSYFNSTTNGVRIKTWQGGLGYAKHITFKNIIMNDVRNPIIIDQNYCDSVKPCHEEKTAVSVSHVYYKDIKGTSASEVAVHFNCSHSVPCHKLFLDDIKLVSQDGSPTKSYCKNYQLSDTGNVFPTCT